MRKSNGIYNYFSLKTFRFTMRLVGMWPVEDQRDRFLSDIKLFYITSALTIGFAIVNIDLYYSWGNLYAISHNLPATITVAVELSNFMKFAINRSEVMRLNAYTENTFWKITYDTDDLYILRDSNRKSMRIIITHIFFSQSVVWLYLSIPLIESAGKNHSDRTLPLALHFNFPYTESPYYEIAYIIESAAIIGTGICATTFAGFLGITNLYLVGQFKILQRKLERAIYDLRIINKNDSTTKITAALSYVNIRDCIKQHQLLLRYLERIENLFSIIIFTQTIGSVFLLSFCGFKLVMGDETSILRKLHNLQFLITSVIQLYLFAWPCHEIIIESQEVAEAAYRASWFCLPINKEGRTCRQFLLIIIARARKPCLLTVGKFTPMSLQTFSMVFNKAISYFMILRQFDEPI